MQSDTRKSWSLNLDLFSLVFLGIIILAFCLRFYDLASKPLHHDESLYGVYCWRFFTGEGYKYDPMMHGPFMFHFQWLIFFLFGVGDFSVRIAPALFGSLMVAGTYYLKDALGKAGALCAALIFTFSPTHLYFSRFMRHDIYSAFFTFAVVVCGILYARTFHKRYLYLTLASLSLMFCVKENAYIHAFIFMTFILLQDTLRIFLTRRIAAQEKIAHFFWLVSTGLVGVPVLILVYFLKHPVPKLLLRLMSAQHWAQFMLVTIHLCAAIWVVCYWLYRKDFRYSQETLFSLLFGVSLFVWIYIFLYSTVFTHRTGALNGMAKSWIYWSNQHSIQRIKGPFHYYVSFIWQYELPVFLIAGGGILYRVANTLNKRIIAVWALVFPALLVWLYGGRSVPLWLAFTHMEVWGDVVLTCCTLGIGGWATIHFIMRREPITAFLTYWSAMGFLIYSYAGEKVPWLFLHILVPVALLAGTVIQQLFSSAWWRERRFGFQWVRIAGIVFGILFGMYTLHSTILLNYYHPANPVETMVYTQTSTDILKLLEIVENVKFTLGSEQTKQPFIAVQGHAVWPLHWYLRDYPGWFHPGDMSEVDRPLVVINWEDRDKYREAFASDYQEVRLKLREWWIPHSGATLKQWWKYFLHRKVFNPTGSSDVALYIRQIGY